ncbi:MAG: xylanase [Bacteroidales bacterium]|nr:xylanase [Bacteroidales bacterium]OJX92466.1 MAG: xylanase [Paludibacter sp. 47-17]
MKHVVFLSAISLLCTLLVSADTVTNPPHVVQFTIDPATTHQQIDNFSASDGWSMQFIGKWPQHKQEQMADWLFSTENNTKGQPKGIGLSLWRFNIGAGSSEQGDASQIGSVWTRSECFLSADGTYDWTKQAGQRHFMQLAKKRGVDQFLGFILSAPVHWTQNGLATNTGRGATFNLKAQHYHDFARFMADVVEGIERTEGIRFNYISPFNEPDGHWNWVGPKQEGTAATNAEIARTVRLTGQEFARRNIDTRILVTESFDYNCMYRTHPYVRADRGYQIQSFFTRDSSLTYIGDVPNVPRLMAAHSYWTNTPLTDLKKIRQEMGEVLRAHRVRFWQTEVCIMNNDTEIGGGGGFDRSMKTALYVARIMHHDLVYANASAWQWWRSVATGDYKDGLILATPDETLVDGQFTDSKLMWTIGNFSRFIRPGAMRIHVTGRNNDPESATNQEGLMVSAYRNTDNSIVVVVINYSTDEQKIRMNLHRPRITFQPYLTDDVKGNDLKPIRTVQSGSVTSIPPRSVITFVAAQ